LTVREVARILIGDGDAQFAHRGGRSKGGKEFVHVFDEAREFRGARVVLEEIVILLQRRSAAAGVSDDRVESVVDERIDILAGELTRAIAQSGVDVQRSATGLAGRGCGPRLRWPGARGRWLR
jgi:hypothetical protein